MGYKWIDCSNEEFKHVKGMRLFFSLGVPNIEYLVLHFEGLARVGERKFEKDYFLVVKKLFRA